jgi:hypothetical protein
MASINDVFDALNDIKGKLDVVHGDETTNGNRITTTNTRLTTLNTSVNDVGNRLEARLIEVRDEEQVANAILAHESQQFESMICALNAIATGVCTLVNIAAHDSALLASIADSSRVGADIARSVSPAAALDLARRDEAAAALAACCPPEPEKPTCEFEPCADPGAFKAMPEKVPQGPG